MSSVPESAASPYSGAGWQPSSLRASIGIVESMEDLDDRGGYTAPPSDDPISFGVGARADQATPAGSASALRLGNDHASLQASRDASRMDYRGSPAGGKRLSEILPGALYIGGFREVNDVNVARALRLRAFLCVAAERSLPTYVTAHDVESGAVRFQHLAASDSAEQPLHDIIPPALAFIDECLLAGRPLALYCQQGRSRSASIAVAYIMRTRSVGFNEALARLRQVHRSAEPNIEFVRQLELLGPGCRNLRHLLQTPRASFGGAANHPLHHGGGVGPRSQSVDPNTSTGSPGDSGLVQLEGSPPSTRGPSPCLNTFGDVMPSASSTIPGHSSVGSDPHNSPPTAMLVAPEMHGEGHSAPATPRRFTPPMREGGSSLLGSGSSRRGLPAHFSEIPAAAVPPATPMPSYLRMSPAQLARSLPGLAAVGSSSNLHSWSLAMAGPQESALLPSSTLTQPPKMCRPPLVTED